MDCQEKGEVMLHAAFQLLADFVEQESPDRYIDWNRNAAHRRDEVPPSSDARQKK
jgi:hypothetical protein